MQKHRKLQRFHATIFATHAIFGAFFQFCDVGTPYFFLHFQDSFFVSLQGTPGSACSESATWLKPSGSTLWVGRIVESSHEVGRFLTRCNSPLPSLCALASNALTWHGVIRVWFVIQYVLIPVLLFAAMFTTSWYVSLSIFVHFYPFYLFNKILQLSQGFRAFRFATFLALGLQRRVSVAGQSSLKCRLAQLVSSRTCREWCCVGLHCGITLP